MRRKHINILQRYRKDFLEKKGRERKREDRERERYLDIMM